MYKANDVSWQNIQAVTYEWLLKKIYEKEFIILFSLCQHFNDSMAIYAGGIH